jgi:hypothetical protein
MNAMARNICFVIMYTVDLHTTKIKMPQCTNKKKIALCSITQLIYHGYSDKKKPNLSSLSSSLDVDNTKEKVKKNLNCTCSYIRC